MRGCVERAWHRLASRLHVAGAWHAGAAPGACHPCVPSIEPLAPVPQTALMGADWASPVPLGPSGMGAGEVGVK